MATIGELAQVAGPDMKGCVDDLCPYIMEMLQDSSSLSKREVALGWEGRLGSSWRTQGRLPWIPHACTMLCWRRADGRAAGGGKMHVFRTREYITVCILLSVLMSGIP